MEQDNEFGPAYENDGDRHSSNNMQILKVPFEALSNEAQAEVEAVLQVTN
jgi:hypothetical protein